MYGIKLMKFHLNCECFHVIMNKSYMAGSGTNHYVSPNKGGLTQHPIKLFMNFRLRWRQFLCNKRQRQYQKELQ